jgi:hypothetical protein
LLDKLGDLSTLAEPGVVGLIKKKVVGGKWGMTLLKKS